jgi:polygalacturonase
MLARHFVTRKGVTMPNTTALVSLMVGSCWDQMCWEILSHSFTPSNGTHRSTSRTVKTDDNSDTTSGNSAPWPLQSLPVTTGGANKPTVKLTDFGGKADGVTDNQPAFSKAFAELARSSGGTLIVPRVDGSTDESVYLTLPLEITVSNLTLILEAGTRVKAKTDTVLSHAGDWPTVAPWANGIDGTALQYAPFVHAVNVSDLVITGEVLSLGARLLAN